jgi:glycosyltransferase involved in cell wall biosynthesis
LDFADKILYLLDNPALRVSMGRVGRERVEKELAWKYEAPKLLKAYETLLKGGVTPRAVYKPLTLIHRLTL